MGTQAETAEGTPPANDQDTDNNTDSTPSNRDVKNHPLFQQMTQQVAELKKFKDTQDAAESARAQEAAEAEQDYAKATQLAVETAKTELRKQIEAEQAVKDAKAEARFQLVKAGFKNDKFIKGLLDDFDPAKMSADEFAKAAADDKENVLFLDMPTGKKPAANPDPPAPPAGQKKRLSDDEIAKLSESEKAEERRQSHLAARMKWVEENTGKAI